MRLLAQREHSRRELTRKLTPHAESPEELQTLLDDLERGNQLSEQRFAEGRARALARKFGAARIEHDLRERGVAAEAAAQASSAARATEFDRARAVWLRKFGSPPSDRNARARQARFLLSRGFSSEIVNRVLRASDD